LVSKAKLLLIPCSGEETAELAKDIADVLRVDLNLGDQVEILFSHIADDIEKGTPKDNRHPLVCDFFADSEAQVDIGRNDLKDVIRGRDVFLVEHLLTPDRRIFENSDQTVHVNDHIALARGILDVINNPTNNVEPLQTTLIAPYITYVRSHSVDWYTEQGFYQANTLQGFIRDFVSSGLNRLITIDPHSERVAEIAQKNGLNYHPVNPFQSGRSINPYKLGLSSNAARKVMNNLRPFHDRFIKLREELKEEDKEHLYVVSVDDGTEKRVENFAERCFQDLPPEEVYQRVIYFDKKRESYDGTKSKIKHFSQINENNIDKQGTYIIIDDMYASGGTAQKIAEYLKRNGAKRVEVWTSHAVTMPQQYEKGNNREYIDRLVCLDTIPHGSKLNAEYVKASAYLLAAEVYKAHQKMMSSR